MNESKPKTSREAISAKGLVELRAEIEELEGPRRREMAARIKTARELGDLSENADYHIAKEDQAHLETKIKRLRAKLRNAEVVEVDTEAETFAFGRTAEVRDDATAEVRTWTLVGAAEAAPSEGRISVETPVGAALRDAPVGQSVRAETPAGEKIYTVVKLVG